MLIRQAISDDIDDIVEIIQKVLPIMIASGNNQWDETYPNKEIYLEDIKIGELWICESTNADHQPKVIAVAAVTTHQDPNYADCGWNINEIAIVPHRLAVHPDYQRRGAAKQLIQKAEQIAIEKGINRVRVDTNTTNRSMLEVFRKLNYTYHGDISLSCKEDKSLRFSCYEKIFTSN